MSVIGSFDLSEYILKLLQKKYIGKVWYYVLANVSKKWNWIIFGCCDPNDSLTSLFWRFKCYNTLNSLNLWFPFTDKKYLIIGDNQTWIIERKESEWKSTKVYFEIGLSNPVIKLEIERWYCHLTTEECYFNRYTAFYNSLLGKPYEKNLIMFEKCKFYTFDI